MQRWTSTSVRQLIERQFRGHKIIAVSNREPYLHLRRNGGLECMQPAGGLTAALDPVMRACRGVWVAHGSSVERMGRADRVMVPPEDPAYMLSRVRLSPSLEEDYYCGFANQALWPLCHMAYQRPQFRRKDWKAYQSANRIFAEAVLKEANGGPAVVLVQDYHLALLPRLLKQANRNLIVTHFWHIPWPTPEAFNTLPWANELLEGLLGNDLIGFHLPEDCSNFLATVERTTPYPANGGYVAGSSGLTRVGAFPIGIDFDSHTRKAAGKAADPKIARDMSAALVEWWAEIGSCPEIVGIGIDRIDYTKGIAERLAAIDLLLEEHPEYLGRLVFVQVAAPSRTGVPLYRRLADEITSQAAGINKKWGTRAWKPIVLIQRHIDQDRLVALHLLADFCAVTSLHDGMNLVAKEFVASRLDQDGVLVLSRFAGASRELTDALLVNPFSIEEIAEAIDKAIRMTPAERRRRMACMREIVSGNTVYDWAGRFFTAVAVVASRSPQDEEGMRLLTTANVA